MKVEWNCNADLTQSKALRHLERLYFIHRLYLRLLLIKHSNLSLGSVTL